MNRTPLGIRPADFLLPAAHVGPSAWACVACDQYTSQPDYWQQCADLVGNAPSCLKLVLPECYLKEADQRVPRIHAEMAKYLADGTLCQPVTDGFVLVERTTVSGKRLGLVCAADLEQYDYTGKKSLIRPTEETIASRLPARLAVRRGAPLEASHVMLLLDDPGQTVIEALYRKRQELTELYDFPLMLSGGRLKGWAITGEEDKAELHANLTALLEALGPEPLLFAVGDGNHSLATAKAHWEEIKQTLSPEEQAAHPARYAMVEVVNIHDEALKFEPIHRLVKGVCPCDLLADWAEYALARGMTMNGLPTPGEHAFHLILEGCEFILAIGQPEGAIPAATLQTYLDDFLARHPEAEIDYIHGDESLRMLVEKEGAIGFLLPPLKKEDFFQAVHALGMLPRKTFSMGHAEEKRFYMECRQII